MGAACLTGAPGHQGQVGHRAHPSVSLPHAVAAPNYPVSFEAWLKFPPTPLHEASFTPAQDDLSLLCTITNMSFITDYCVLLVTLLCLFALDAPAAGAMAHISLGSHTCTAASTEVLFRVPWVQGPGSPSRSPGSFEPQARHYPFVPGVPFSGAPPHPSLFGKMSVHLGGGGGKGEMSQHFHGLWTRKDGHVWD